VRTSKFYKCFKRSRQERTVDGRVDFRSVNKSANMYLES
jgi:hypothetical protein